ncbi:MAG: M3 family oligoendopeptidase [Chlamydiae bacterium]|nr:M3 family oligoendopeptidase [Chlamydiota bacterium]
MTKEPFPLQWDLDRFFQNKGTQEDLSQFIDCLKNHLEELSLALEDASSLPKALQLSQTIAEKLAQLEAFGHCLFAEDVKNTCSLQLQGECRLLQAKFENLSTLLDEHLKNLSDASFKSLLKDPFCQTVAFPIQERKSLAQEKLSLSLESLITNLSIDGYHGYSQLFSTFHGHLNFPFQDAQGLPSTLSIGQIDNLLSSPDREIRCRSFKIYTQVFHEHAPHFAEILNHIGGFRLQVYKQRNWHCFLKEPLQANRMQEATLNSLWEAVQTHTQGFAKFLKKKAALLHLEALDWHDVDAPLFSSTQTIPYATACETILEQFHNYSPKMASFAKRALTQRWVEAEDRPGKAAGGFCIPLPLHKESRIFMTYSGTQDNVSTLAHELGHAYHNEILFSHPYLAQNIK